MNIKIEPEENNAHKPAAPDESVDDVETDLANWYAELDAIDSADDATDEGEQNKPPPETPATVAAGSDVDAKPEPAATTEPATEPTTEPTTEPAPAAAPETPLPNNAVPVAKYSAVNRDNRKLRREAHDWDKKESEYLQTIKDLQMAAKAAGVPELSTEEIEIDDDLYLELYDQLDEKTANLLLQQQNQLKALQAKIADQPVTHSDDEIVDAIEANPTLLEWRNNAQSGDRAAWDRAVAADAKLTGDYPTLDERYDALVASLNTAPAPAPAPQKTPPPTATRSLDTQSGTAPIRGGSPIDTILSLPESEQMRAIARLPQNERDKIESILFAEE